MTMEHLLYDSAAKGVDVATAQVFGRLLNLGVPLLTHFHSDLYHDALWLQEHLTGTECTFFYGVRQTGTLVGFSLEYVKPYSTRTFAVTVKLDNGKVMYGADLVV